MERFCKHSREHATRIMNYEKKEMIPLTDEELIKSRKFVTHTKKNLVQIKTIKMYLNCLIK